MKSTNRLAATVVALFLASISDAAIVQFKVEGQLALVAGNDLYGLDGATYSITFRGDTTTSPTAVAPFGQFGTTAYYYVDNFSIAFTGRPGGLPDASVPFNPSYDIHGLRTENGPDEDASDSVSRYGPPSSLTGEFLGLKTTRSTAYFSTPLFPGLGAGPMPTEFSASVGLQGGDWTNASRTVFYRPSGGGSFSASTVPIPATAWLLATGIVGLGGRRWMRRKVSG